MTTNNIISPTTSIKEAMAMLNLFPAGLTLFVINPETGEVIGTLTDGDIRRGLLSDLSLSTPVEKVMRRSFKYLTKGNYYNEQIEGFKAAKIKIVPLLDESKKLIRVFDLTILKNVLPLDVVIMAGGKGERLKPLTDSTPKPLLPVGNKPIIEHNIDRLISNGIDNFYISINYLGNKIRDYFSNGKSKGVNIQYIEEDKPLGTIGAVSQVTDFQNENILVMNSDLLTNIDFADFYKEFVQREADIAIATIPYNVSIPYAVIETENMMVKNINEKPTYTYFSNAGIYIIKKDLLKRIPGNTFHNATDFIDTAIKNADRVISYPLLGYWLDIGMPADYMKAQEDIKHISL